VTEVKYLGVILKAGTSFCVDSVFNCRKFLGSVFAILQKTKNISEEVKCHIIQHSCLPILSYGTEAVTLTKKQVHGLSVAYNTAIRRCFGLSRMCSVRFVLRCIGSIPLDILLHKRRLLLVKDCISRGSNVLRFCGLIALSESKFQDFCYLYDVHVNMSRADIQTSIYQKFAASIV